MFHLTRAATVNLVTFAHTVGTKSALLQRLAHVSINLTGPNLQFLKIPLQTMRLYVGEPESISDLSSKHSVDEASDVKTLLAIVNKDKNAVFEALRLMAERSTLKDFNFEQDIESDENYPRFVKALERYNPRTKVYEIIRGLENLKQLKVKNDHPIIESLENDLLWHVRKVSLQELFTIIKFQKDHLETVRQKLVMTQSIEAVEQRWNELRGSEKELADLYSLESLFSKKTLKQFEDRLVDIIPHMSFAALCRLLNLISTCGRRPTPVLRAIAYHLFKDDNDLTINQATSALLSLHKINYIDEALLDKLSGNLMEKISTTNKSNRIGTLMFAMGKMRWRDTSLLDLVTDWFIDNIDISRSSDLSVYVITLAQLSYIPTRMQELINIIRNNINTDDIEIPQRKVDLIWALCLLNEATVKQVSSVLSAEFVAKFDKSDVSNTGMILKLLNICAFYETTLVNNLMDNDEIKESKEKMEQIPINIKHFRKSTEDNISISTNQHKLQMEKLVYSTLTDYLPTKYIRTNINTPYGFNVNVELIVDSDAKPIPYEPYTSNFGQIEPKKTLQKGVSKVVLMIWDYKSYTIVSQELLGQNLFAVETLEKLGYKVVHIPFYELNVNEKIVSRVQYFERKIKEAVNSVVL